MRHRVDDKKLGRTKDQRQALIKGLSEHLISNEKIVTTTPKAKYLKRSMEKLVTKAKLWSTEEDKISKFNVVKYLRKHLNSDMVVNKLVSQIAPANLERNGGYTKITKVGNRDGDNAEMSRIEFVEKTVKANKSKEAKQKTEEKTKEIKEVAKKDTKTKKETVKKLKESK